LILCPRRLKRLSDVSASDWCDLEVFLMHLYDENDGIPSISAPLLSPHSHKHHDEARTN
jgi:hypothetical protein